jgi:uncharacterized protein
MSIHLSRISAKLLLGAAILVALVLLEPGPGLAGREWFQVILDGHRLEVELALTRAERMRGLSGRTFLGENRGMLFIYKNRRPLRFWMNGMKIGLDLFWLDGPRVVGIEHGIEPPGPGQTPLSVFSPGPADRVLEVKAGWAKRHGVRTGAILIGPKKK